MLAVEAGMIIVLSKEQKCTSIGPQEPNVNVRSVLDLLVHGIKFRNAWSIDKAREYWYQAMISNCRILPSLDNQLLQYLDDEDFGTDVHVHARSSCGVGEDSGLKFKFCEILTWRLDTLCPRLRSSFHSIPCCQHKINNPHIGYCSVRLWRNVDEGVTSGFRLPQVFRGKVWGSTWVQHRQQLFCRQFKSYRTVFPDQYQILGDQDSTATVAYCRNEYNLLFPTEWIDFNNPSTAFSIIHPWAELTSVKWTPPLLNLALSLALRC